MIPEKAWERLENAYILRGRVKKKYGYSDKGRLRVCYTNPAEPNTAALLLTETVSSNTFSLSDVFSDPSLNNASTYSGAYLEEGSLIILTDGERLTDDKGTLYENRFLASPGIIGITQANPGVVTTGSDHDLNTGDTVQFVNMSGMTELEGITSTITVLSPTTFSILLDTTAFGAFVSGSYLQHGNITNIMQANPGVVTVPNHGYSNGDRVLLSSVGGMVEVNGETFSISNVTTDTFEIGDTSAFSPYTSGGLSERERGNVNYASHSIEFDSRVTTSPVRIDFCAFPYRPCMGIHLRERVVINNEQTISFDNLHAYRFVKPNWECLPSTASVDDYTTGSTTITLEGYDLAIRDGDILFITGVVGTGDVLDLNDEFWIAGTVTPNLATQTTDVVITGGPNSGTYTSGGSVRWCASWTGTNYQFFWAKNFDNFSTDQLLFFSTNGNFSAADQDPLRFYDGVKWLDYQPPTGNATLADPVTFLLNSKIFINYKERALALHTFEQTGPGTFQIFENRIRYSALGNLLDTEAGTEWYTAFDSVREGLGGFIDIPTPEQIVSVGMIRDRVIIYCERSSWELVYTGNEQEPFQIRRINIELGVESKMSTIQFDDSVMGIGDKGIHSCNGDSVSRVDLEIPTLVYDFHNGLNGVQRVYGIRDYYNELVFWSFPDSRDGNDTTGNRFYPDSVLIYNYRDPSWAVWRDTFTAFGYLQRQDDVRWRDLTVPWSTYNVAWKSGTGQSLYSTILSGNHVGFMFTMASNTSNTSISRSVKDFSVEETHLDGTPSIIVLESTQHMLNEGDYITLTDMEDWTGFEEVYSVILGDAADNNKQDFFRITPSVGNSIVDNGGEYRGNGKVQKYDNVSIKTKFFIPYWKEAAGLSVNYVDYLLSTTSEGKLIHNIFMNNNNTESLTETGAGNLGDHTILTSQEPEFFNAPQKYNWHRGYVNAYGDNMQIEMTMNDEQMKDKTVNQSEVTLHGMMISVQKDDELV